MHLHFFDLLAAAHWRPQKNFQSPVGEGTFVPVRASGIDGRNEMQACELLSRHLAQGVCLADVVGDCRLRVVFENEAFRRLGGLPALVGTRTAELIRGVTQADPAAARARLVGENGLAFQAWACSQRGGAMRMMLLSDPPEDAGSNASQAEGVFLTTLGHELRNGLAPLRYAVDVLGSGVGHSFAKVKALEIARRQLRNMSRSVSELMDAARPLGDRLQLNLAEVIAQDIVGDSAADCEAEAARRHVTVTVEMPEEPIRLRADEVRIDQVLANLLGNSCKFTPPGGWIHVGLRREGSRAVISVADNGVGIEPAELDSVFTMFHQQQSSRALSPEGFGIGLAVVRRIVELHGGTVSVASEGPGRGSTFTVSLPLAGPPSRA